MEIFEGIILCIVTFYLIAMTSIIKVTVTKNTFVVFVARKSTFGVFVVKLLLKGLPIILGLLCLIFALELFGVVAFL